ncbi:MAG TPA: glycosyltransferase family 2 protein [Candidatus Limnocylindrales bacterium]|nr:glycosyltransferase family 2 protein [Candidatus Limnocylindrales bacterium]
MIRRLVFWASAGLVAFTYVGAPLLILVRAAARPRPVRAAPIEPSVSIVIAARNEAASIGARLSNLAALDYPPDRLEVIVASDGSEDRTVEIARGASAEDGRVTILDLDRVGKADALNAAVERATGDVVVFTDANSAFAPDAVRALVRPLADPEVGGVAGNQVYTAEAGEAHGTGERDYWDFDRMMKRAESAAGSTVSATGAIYALRRELVPTIVAGVTDDFYTSTAVIDRGRRLVFAEDAIAYEPPAKTTSREYGRKVRIISRGFRGVAARQALLDPRRTGFYAVQLAWHKLLRRLMAAPVLVMGATSLLLARESRFHALVALSQLGGYALAAIGLFAPESRIGRSRPVALGSFFVMVNLASLHAAINVLRGKRIERWEPTRSAHDGPAAGGGEDAA